MRQIGEASAWQALLERRVDFAQLGGAGAGAAKSYSAGFSFSSNVEWEYREQAISI